MAKKTRQLLILLVVLGVMVVLLLAGITWSSYQASQEAAAQAAASPAIETVTDPVTLTYSNGEHTLSFAYDEETDAWYYQDDPDFPLDDSTVTSILSELESLTAVRAFAPEEDLDAYGLADSANYLTVTDADGNSATLCFGIESGSEYFACLDGQEDTIYTVESTLYSEIQTTLYEQADSTELIPTLTESILSALDISGAQETSITVKAVEVEVEDEEEEADAEESSDDTESTDDAEADEPEYETVYYWYCGEQDITGQELQEELLSELTGLGLETLSDYSTEDSFLETRSDQLAATVRVTYTETDDEGETSDVDFTIHLLEETTTEEDGTQSTQFYAVVEGYEGYLWTVDADSVQWLCAVAQDGYEGAMATLSAEAEAEETEE